MNAFYLTTMTDKGGMIYFWISKKHRFWFDRNLLYSATDEMDSGFEKMFLQNDVKL